MNMKDHLVSFLAGITFLSLFLVTVPLAHAQTAEGVDIKPGIVEDRVNPGDVYHFTLKVKNLFTGVQTFTIQKQDISGLDDQGRPVFAPEGRATGYELSTWITTTQESVTLAPNETAAVLFTVHVPKEAAPGSHFGGVFFTTKPTQANANGAGVGIQVGSVISLRISGETSEDARLREFTSVKSVYDSPKVTFRMRVENLGNVLLRPHGVIDITDMRGKKVETVSVNDSAAPVFPGTDRIYSPVWDFHGFAFGRYQAVLSVIYGDDSRKTVSSVTSFWVLPVKLILIVLGSLLAAILILFALVRMYVRRKLAEMGAGSKGSDTSYYDKKYNQSASRMAVLVSVMFLFAIACLVALFLLFA